MERRYTGQVFMQAPQRMHFSELQKSGSPNRSLRPLSTSTMCISVPGRGEAHHMGFTDDRRHLWAGRLDDSKIFVFDLEQVIRIRTGERGEEAI